MLSIAKCRLKTASKGKAKSLQRTVGGGGGGGTGLQFTSEPVFVNLLRSPGIDSQPAGR
jgi:hypothetical protein